MLLQNGHNNPSLLNRLEVILSEFEQTPSQDFRMWITAQTTEGQIPVTVLQKCQKIMVERPRVSIQVLVECENTYKSTHVLVECESSYNSTHVPVEFESTYRRVWWILVVCGGH